MAEELEKLINNEEALKQICQGVFNQFDKDKSGELDTNELEAIMKDVSKDLKIDPPTKDDVQQFLATLDKDKSGKISMDEFSVFLKKILQIALEALKAKK